jgi:hypothetical protein
MADKKVSEEGDGDDTEEGEGFDEDAPDLDEIEDMGDNEADGDGGKTDDGKADDGEDEDDDDDDVTPPKPATDDDDDDDVDPSDLEADLDEILRERIAANDDEDEDDDESSTKTARKKASVAPKRSDEWTCNQCFLIVSSSQFGTKDDPRCPSGEDPCVSLKRALG